jgi:hypothetical protein
LGLDDETARRPQEFMDIVTGRPGYPLGVRKVPS